jgi:glycosyltransferase involved in cell wall biosynthesis
MKISIITVCFNSAATLQATLESVASQRDCEFEHIVVDGGSTDGTLALLDGWRGHPIKLVPGPDRGIYDAMNKGIAAATGDVIGLLNADDRYADADVLSSIAGALADPSVDCCQSDLVFVDATSRAVLRYWRSSEFERRQFAFGWLPAHPTLYVRRELFLAVGPFNLDYRVGADVEWMIRLFSRPGLRCAYIPRVLVVMDSGGVSNSGLGAFVHANREVWRACRALRVSPAPFVFGKTARKLPQWWRRRRAA